MSSLPLFDLPEPMPPQATRLGPKLHALADRGVYVGTSSWKYPGWLGSVYSPDRYQTRGKFSRAKFDAECLIEYADTFPTVCGDFAFYQFPTSDYWKRLFEGTPQTLSFGFKVPEDITVAKWPTHARYGTRAGNDNNSFLDANVFTELFTRRLEPYKNRVATLIFEFGTFNKSMFPKPDDFLAAIGPFFESLPEGFRYAIEIRNPEYLSPAYFDLLATHRVAHTLNAWTRMPELGEQLALPGVFTADFTVVRALLSRGRAYEQAVKTFEPYAEIQEPNEGVREAMSRIVARSMESKIQAYIYVNNRLEGHAPTTIEAVADSIRL